jgi:hypothetical protein
MSEKQLGDEIMSKRPRRLHTLHLDNNCTSLERTYMYGEEYVALAVVKKYNRKL